MCITLWIFLFFLIKKFFYQILLWRTLANYTGIFFVSTTLIPKFCRIFFDVLIFTMKNPLYYIYNSSNMFTVFSMQEPSFSVQKYDRGYQIVEVLFFKFIQSYKRVIPKKGNNE